MLFFAGFVSTCFSYTANDFAKTISSDGTYSDTAAAVNYVAGKNVDGWVLTVGAAGASYTWASSLGVNISHVFTIQGASPSDRPTITCANSGTAITLGCTASKTITFKDFIFNEWSSGTLIQISGSGVDCFRLTNLKFNHSSGSITVAVSGLNPQAGKGPYGLIDQCEINSGGSGYGFFIRENQQAETGFTPGSWTRPMTFGTRDAVYIEDCNFHATSLVTGRPSFDGDSGGRVVFRHNTSFNFSTTVHGAESAGGGAVNSMLQCELMHNNWDTDSSGQDFCFFLRGGTGVFFDNTVSHGGSFNFGTKLMYYRAGTAGNNVAIDRFYPADYVGTQQPGCGVVGTAGQDPRYPSRNWGCVPFYSWGNHFDKTPFYGEANASNDGSFCQLNRDYFVGTPKPGYTEFTYPHPLRSGGPSPSATPNPPSNLRIISGP